jgi:malate dehydrogenase
MAKAKISLIGGGNIGGVLTLIAAQKELGDLVLYDIVEGMPQGKALYIVTAGFPRKPGMSRDDLLAANLEIIKDVSKNIKKHSPNAMVIIVSNPLDVMVWSFKELTGFPRERVVGMAGVLDSARFRYFVAERLGVSVQDVVALVLGGHGPTMVPLPRYCSVSGIPLTKLMDQATIDAIVKRVQDAGTEIVGLLKTGSAYFSPAQAAIDMAESILLDQKRVLPGAAYLEGEYGVSGIYMGVPMQLGASGLEKIIELDLDSNEQAALKKSVEHVQKIVAEVKL